MKRAVLIFSIAVTSLIINCLFAQRLSFQTYTVQDGLIANPVRRIFQDSKGFIWIATWEGLSKYDGYKFTNYSTANGLSDNLINDLHETKDGKILIAENNGSVDMMMPDGTIKRNFFKDVIINQFFKTKNGNILGITDENGIYEINKGNFFKPV